MHRQQGSKGLGNAARLIAHAAAQQTGGVQLGGEDGIGGAQPRQAFLRHLAQATHSQPRPGEGLPPDQFGGQAQRLAHGAHLILEQVTQRFNQRKTQVTRQTANVVMRLNPMCLVAVRRARLDHIRVDSALHQEGNFTQAARLGLKQTDESLTNDFALRLRLDHTAQRTEEALPPLNRNQVQPQAAPQGIFHLLALPLTQQTVLHKHSRQLSANGTMHQGRRHARIHPPAHRRKHPLPAHLRTNALDRLLNNRGRRPGWRSSANLAHKAAQDLAPARGMMHLRVKLHPIPAALHIAHRRHRAIGAGCKHPKALRQLLNPVTVRHPHRIGPQRQKWIIGHGLDLRQAIFARLRRPHLPAQGMRQQLHPIANAKHRQTGTQQILGQCRRIVLIDRRRAAGENVATRLNGLHRLSRRIPGEKLAIDLHLAHPPRNQLRILRAKVENGNRRPHRISSGSQKQICPPSSEAMQTSERMGMLR